MHSFCNEARNNKRTERISYMNYFEIYVFRLGLFVSLHWSIPFLFLNLSYWQIPYEVRLYNVNVLWFPLSFYFCYNTCFICEIVLRLDPEIKQQFLIFLSYILLFVFIFIQYI
jgi:hypothetical protein